MILRMELSVDPGWSGDDRLLATLRANITTSISQTICNAVNTATSSAPPRLNSLAFHKGRAARKEST